MSNDIATSDLIAVMALIAVFVTATAIAGVTLLSNPPGDAAPAMLMHIETDPDAGIIYAYHDGGDPIERGHFAILVDGVDRTENFSLADASMEDPPSTDWTSWRTGQALVLVPNADVTISEDPHIQIVGEGMSRTGSGWLLYGTEDRTGAEPTQTITSTPTATVTPVPTVTVTPTTTATATSTPTPVPPVASFTASPTSGPAPLAVTFTDTSTGGPTSWSWDFGDGTPLSTQRNPSHTYAAAGTYTVTLTATNPGGSDTETKVIHVTVAELQPPTVTSITPGSGKSGTTVSITNLAGTDFQSGATVKLTKSGEPDIHATGVTVGSSTQITCLFNLAGASTGQWNVIVANPDAQSGTLSNGFEVTTAQIYEPEPDLNDELTHWTTSGNVYVVTEDDVVIMTDASSMSRDISTEGYVNIIVSFRLAAGFNNPHEQAFVEWFNGTSWEVLLRIDGNKDLPNANGEFHNFSYPLPPSADNNPSFAIRFRLTHQGNTESIYVDLKNLEIIGDPI